MFSKNILVFNCGSSSVKFSVLNLQDESIIANGIIEALTTKQPIATIKYLDLNANKIIKLADKQKLSQNSYSFAIEFILDKLLELNILSNIKAVGHRVVHGGDYFSDSVKINNDVLSKIKKCIDLAPLHNPANIQGIEISKKYFDNLDNINHTDYIDHVACFDTAFHQTMTDTSFIYPLPYEWYLDYKVRKYGFHGMSHKYISIKAAEFLHKELENTAFISVHLGNGCSGAAILHGSSVDTTMGMTPLEGLMMGTRSGNIDPSIIFYLSNKLSVPAEDIYNMLNNKSGLLGVSGISSDCRAIEDIIYNKNNNDKLYKRANLAIELFCYILAKYIAMLAVPLGRLDALIFTGGIGENSSLIRQKVINNLSILNLKIDNIKNNNINKINNNMGSIAKANSFADILVIPTNEELMIAKDVVKVLNI